MPPSADKVAIGLIQMSCASELRLNLEKAVARIEEAAKRGAHIVCTQELFRAHYPCHTEDPKIFDLAEPIPPPTPHPLRALPHPSHLVLSPSPLALPPI